MISCSPDASPLKALFLKTAQEAWPNQKPEEKKQIRWFAWFYSLGKSLFCVALDYERFWEQKMEHQDPDGGRCSGDLHVQRGKGEAELGP